MSSRSMYQKPTRPSMSPPTPKFGVVQKHVLTRFSRFISAYVRVTYSNVSNHVDALVYSKKSSRVMLTTSILAGQREHAIKVLSCYVDRFRH